MSYTYVKREIDDNETVLVKQYDDGTLSDYFDCPVCEGTNTAEMNYPGTPSMWVCNAARCDASGVCAHSDTNIENVETMDTAPSGTTGSHYDDIYVCDWCDQQVEGDPAADAQDARNAIAEDEARDEQ